MVTKKPKITLIDQFNGPGGTLVAGDLHQFIPKEAFYAQGQYFIGGQTDSWAGDLTGWDDLKYGRWAGGGAMFAVPKEVSVVDGSLEEDPETLDPVYRLSSGATISASFTLSDPNFVYSPYAYMWEVVNTNTGDRTGGEIKMYGGGRTTSPEVTGLADGSYIFRVKIHGFLPAQLPVDYTVNGAYRYIENGLQYVYDPEYNIGKVPQDENHILLKIRQEIVLSGTQKDKPAWTRYLSSSDALSSEWSQVKIVIGSAVAWSHSEAILGSVGPVLFALTIPETGRTPVNFDPLARSISASAPLTFDVLGPDGTTVVVEEGSYLFAGNRSTVTGVVLALWALKPDGSIVLLGTNLNPSTGVCECGLSDHSATRIRVDKAYKRIYVLTKCSLHEYTHTDQIVEALPGIPAGSGGHPGGHALAVLNNNLTFFTENLGTFGAVKGSTHFYNVLVRQVAGVRYAGQGTVYQGFNCADTWLGKLWGFYQDKPFSDPEAKVSLAYFDGLNWATRATIKNTPVIDSLITFNSSDYLWQRVISCNGLLLATGKVADLTGYTTESAFVETPASFVADGKTHYLMSIPYRASKLITAPSDNPEKDKLFLIGHQVVSNNLDKTNYFVVELDLEGDVYIATQCNDEPYCFCTEALDISMLEAQGMFSPYLWFRAGVWEANNFPPSDPMTLFLSRSLTGGDGEVYVRYCDTCAISQECESNCANFFSFSWDDGWFEITEDNLLAKYALSPLDLKPYIVLTVSGDSFCFVGQDTVPNPGEIYLTLATESGLVKYVLPGGVSLPFNPLALTGPGNSLQPNSTGLSLCVVRCGPPYDYSTCASLRFHNGQVDTGNVVEGVFIPCSAKNPKDVVDELPPGSGWKTVHLSNHAENKNIVSIVDTNRDSRLKKLNQLYPLLWYRRTDTPAYTGSNEADYLASFEHKASFSSLVLLGKEMDTPLEVLTVVPSFVENTSLPIVVKVV